MLFFLAPEARPTNSPNPRRAARARSLSSCCCFSSCDRGEGVRWMRVRRADPTCVASVPRRLVLVPRCARISVGQSCQQKAPFLGLAADSHDSGPVWQRRGVGGRSWCCAVGQGMIVDHTEIGRLYTENCRAFCRDQVSSIIHPPIAAQSSLVPAQPRDACVTPVARTGLQGV